MEDVHRIFTANKNARSISTISEYDALRRAVYANSITTDFLVCCPIVLFYYVH